MSSIEQRSVVMTRRSARRLEGGFTLVELLIVVLILGSLASTVVVASGGFKDKGAVQACQAARDAYAAGFEAYRADNADGLYPTNDSQVVPTYVKRSGGSTVSVSGTPEVAVVSGKGWTFTISYGALAAGAAAGSSAEPTFAAVSPSACSRTSGSGAGATSESFTCPTNQWAVSFWNISNAALPTGVPAAAPSGTLPCSSANRPNVPSTVGSPFVGANTDFVVAQWTGTVSLPAGATTFTIVSDDGIRVRVNGTEVIANWTIHAPTTNSGVFTAPSAGLYEVQIDFYEWGGGWATQLISP